MRTFLPVPAGSTTEPRTVWSDFFASTPRLTATSTDSSNLATAVSLTSLSASSTEYALLRSTFARTVFMRFESFGSFCSAAMITSPLRP